MIYTDDIDSSQVNIGESGHMPNRLETVKDCGKFALSFAVVSESKEFIFSTSDFEEISKRNDGLKEYAINKVIFDDSKIEFAFNNLLILKKEFSLYSKDKTLFFIYVKDKIDNHLIIARHCHDIQAPLRNISNFLQLIKTHLINTQDNTVREYIDFAIDNAKELGEFTKEYLSECEKTPYSRIKIKKLINIIIKLLKTQFEKRKCKIEAGDDIPDIEGRYSSIFSLFKNLIENSIEHAISNKLVIKISLVSHSDSKVVIQFEDNGENFNDEKRNKIKKGLKGYSTDSNLGICICKEIVEQHGGNINLNDSSSCSYNIALPIYRG
ncbi:MAG: HAMP domain-containing histidine kinase, partial [Holosporales bacterium]|nr:HAMP domain-containing histidine kinase [Holosporales bacterium]